MVNNSTTFEEVISYAAFVLVTFLFSVL